MGSSERVEAARKNGYIAALQNAERKYKIPQGYLVALAQQESSFIPDIINGTRKSKTGAIGIMQFMPATAAEMGIDPTKPFEAIDAGGKYLARLYKSTNSWKGAMTSYNWGIGNYNKFLKGKRKDIPKEAADYADSVISKAGALGGGKESIQTSTSSESLLGPDAQPSVKFPTALEKDGIDLTDSLVHTSQQETQALPNTSDPQFENVKRINTPNGEMEVVAETDEENNLINELSGSGDMLLQQVPELISARDKLKQQPLLNGKPDTLDKLLGEIIDLV